jgi:hypothetical protein
MNRDYEIEKRISERSKEDRLKKKNSYGGMGMDSVTEEQKQILYKELDYIQKHPEIYKKPPPPTDPNIYLINLK